MGIGEITAARSRDHGPLADWSRRGAGVVVALAAAAVLRNWRQIAPSTILRHSYNLSLQAITSLGTFLAKVVQKISSIERIVQFYDEIWMDIWNK